MSSFLSQGEIDAIREQMYNLHDTFARQIVVYQTATQVVIFSNPENNILFENAPFNSTTETIINSGIINARIMYGKKENLEPFKSIQRNGTSDQNEIRLEHGDVRLKVDVTGAALLSSAERAVFDNTIFDIETSQRPHSVVGPPQFYDFYLKKIQ